jgi:RNA polymerase sigma-70 factor (ECF subfamily)
MSASPLPRPDDELLQAIAAGDRVAFEELYRRYAAWLLVRLRRRCADPALAEEVVQETFLAVWRSSGRYRSRGNADATGWLWRIGMRQLLNHWRGASRRERLRQRLAVTAGRAPSEPAAEERVLAGIELGDLAGALARLSPELRAVLQATVLDGLTTAEAARLLGLPSGTVKTRAMRARAKLRRELV